MAGYEAGGTLLQSRPWPEWSILGPELFQINMAYWGFVAHLELHHSILEQKIKENVEIYVKLNLKKIGFCSIFFFEFGK